MEKITEINELNPLLGLWNELPNKGYSMVIYCKVINYKWAYTTNPLKSQTYPLHIKNSLILKLLTLKIQIIYLLSKI